MLKNWIVKVKQVKGKGKGLQNNVNYLIDQNRPSHYFSKITTLLNNSANIIASVENRTALRKKRGVGGAVIQNFATSMIFSLPRSISQPNPKQWSQMLNLVLKEMTLSINVSIDAQNKKELVNRKRNKSHVKKIIMPEVSFNDLKQHCVAVIHDESASPEKSSHCHVLLSNVINGEFIKPITQKGAIFSAKKAFNNAVLKVLNEDNNDYVPLRKKTFNRPLWAKHEERTRALELKMTKLKSIYSILKADLTSWKLLFLSSMTKFANKKAKKVASSLEELEAISPITAKEIIEIVEAVEDIIPEAPKQSKVTKKRRKRRRRIKNAPN